MAARLLPRFEGRRALALRLKSLSLSLPGLGARGIDRQRGVCVLDRRLEQLHLDIRRRPVATSAVDSAKPVRVLAGTPPRAGGARARPHTRAQSHLSRPRRSPLCSAGLRQNSPPAPREAPGVRTFGCFRTRQQSGKQPRKTPAMAKLKITDTAKTAVPGRTAYSREPAAGTRTSARCLPSCGAAGQGKSQAAMKRIC